MVLILKLILKKPGVVYGADSNGSGYDYWCIPVNSIMIPQVANKEGNFLTSCGTVCLSGRTLLLEVNFVQQELRQSK